MRAGTLARFAMLLVEWMVFANAVAQRPLNNHSGSANMKKRIRLFAVVTFLLLLVALCLSPILFGSYKALAALNLSSDHTLHVWVETKGILDAGWDPGDLPTIYYDVTRGNTVVAHQSFLLVTSSLSYDRQLSTAITKDGSLGCIYDTESIIDRVFVCYDVASNESYPEELSQVDWANAPELSDAIIEKWAARYERLRMENPNLPDYFAALTAPTSPP